MHFIRLAPHLLCSIAAVGALSAGALRTASATEQQVYKLTLADYEFDSARDGNYCASCNYGAGNSRASFVDSAHHLWVVGVDPATGMFATGGAPQLVDFNAAYVSDFGNGPSWIFSQRGSELVYTRYLNGQPPGPSTAGVAMARMTGPGQWRSAFIPGGMARINPKGTQDRSDAVPLISYGDAINPLAYWRVANNTSAEQVLAGDGSNHGLTLRWVNGSSQILYSNTPPGEDTQIYVDDVSSSTSAQITQGGGQKLGYSMVFAPEFGGAAITVVLMDQTHFDVYRQLPGGSGVPQWAVIGQLWPPADLPYVAGSPEVFVYNGRTWIVMTLKSVWPPVAATSVTIAALDPAHPEWRVLTDNSAPNRWRADPEYYMHPDSVYIYYSRTDLSSMRGEGVWRVDTGLGPAQH